MTTYLMQMKLHKTLIKTGLKVDGDCYVLQTNNNKWNRSPVPISHPLTILLLLTKKQRYCHPTQKKFSLVMAFL
jgi:hypothetical protein